MKKKLFMFSILVLILLSGCVNNEPVVKEKQIFVMDTIIDVTVYTESDEVIKAVEEKVKEIEQLMSATIAESDVSSINKFAGIKPVKVNEQTFQVLKTAAKYQELSSDAFQVTIYPLVQLWDIGTDDNSIPAEDDINRIKEYCSSKYLSLNAEDMSVYLTDKNAGIDLGAIAKGYAADEIVKILKQYDVQHALISLGGGIQALGGKLDGKPWVLGLENPIEADKGYFATVQKTEGALVTSGDYQRFKIVNGEKYHHIINSQTGYPVKNSLASVSIWANNSIDADAISTAAYVLGLNKGYEFINSLENTEAMFVTHDKKVIITDGLQNKINIVDEGFVLHEIR